MGRIMIEKNKMRCLAILISLFVFLSVTNSAASTQDRYKERIPKLFELLKKGDVREKQVALQLLWFLDRSEYHKDHKLFAPILKLLNDKNPKVREAAVAKFKRLAEGYKNSFYKSDVANKSVVPALIQALSDKSASVRQEAAKALGYYQDQRAIEPLISAIQDQEVWVRFEAIHALGKIKAGAEAVIPLMNVIVVEDVWPTKLIQQEALKTLALILGQGSVTVRQKKAKDEYYKNGITVRKILVDPRIRGKVIFILLEKINDPYLKVNVIKLLDSMHIQLREDKAERVLKHLIASAGDNNAQIRKLALSSLFSIANICVQDGDKADRKGTIRKYRSIVIDLCIEALKDSSVEVRKKAADLLGKSEDSKSVGPLIAALKDDNPDMKIVVIKALENFRDSRMIEPMLDALSDKSEAVRTRAIKILGNYEDFRVIKMLPPFFDSFKKSDDNASVRRVFEKVAKATKEGVRLVYNYNGKRYVHKIDEATSVILPHNVDANAIKTLLYHPTAVEGILQSLSDPNFKGHVKTLKMLERFEDKRIGQYVIPFLDNPSPAIRKAALQLMYLSINPDKAMPILQGALNDKDAKVQKEARKLLKALEAAFVKDDDSVEQNIYALKNRDYATRLAAVKALMLLNDNKAVDPLINCLNDVNGKVRLHAVKALRQLKDKRAVVPLIQRLDDSDIQVRRAVVDALKNLGDTRAVESLLALTDDKHIKMYVVSALPWFDDPCVTDFFLELLQNQNGKMQLEAVKYFSRNPDQRAVKFLIPLLQSAHKNIPSWAAGALGASKDKRTVEPLIELLTRKLPDNNKEKKRVYSYKRSAILALGKIGDKRAYPMLVDALKDEELIRDAIIGLGRLKDKRAVPILLTYLSDPSPLTRSNAIRSLGNIGDSSLFDKIVPFLSDSYEPISNSAIYAVYRLDPERALGILLEMFETKDLRTCRILLKILGCSKDDKVRNKVVKLAVLRKELIAVIGKQLSKCDDPEIADFLLSYLKEKKDLDIRVAAIDILGEFDSPKIKELLAHYSSNPNPVIRKHASMALEAPKDVLIAKLFEDERSFGVRYNKGRHKGKHRYNVGLPMPSSIGLVTGGDSQRRISGNMALHRDPQIQKMIQDYAYIGYRCVHLEFENPVKVEKLVHQLNDNSPLVRQKATDYLGYLGDATTVPSIVPLLNHRQTFVRTSAARTLGLLNNPSAWSSLVNTLDDLDLNVKDMAVWALGEINDDRAVGPLSTLLKKQQGFRIKEGCVKALAKIDDKAAKDVLIASLAESEDYRVRMLVADAVGMLGDKKLSPLLEARLQDNNEYVRQTAVRSLGKLSGKDAVPLVDFQNVP